MGTRTPAIWLNHAAFWQMLAKSWQIDASVHPASTLPILANNARAIVP